MSCSLRPIGRAQRARLEALTADAGLFSDEEVAIAVELLDEALAGEDDYRFLGAYDGDAMVGYACWGPTPGTDGTYDLYWIAVDGRRRRGGIGTQLMDAVERAIKDARGRMVMVETSSRGEYLPTRRFYEHRGYTRAARIAGYYAPEDDLVIYCKDLTDGDVAGTAA